MGSTLHDGSIRAALCGLKSLTHILTVAESHSDSATFPSARLYSDMEPLTFQVDTATAVARGMLSRMSGNQPRAFETETLTSFPDMQARISEAIKLLEDADAVIINSRVSDSFSVEIGKGRPAVEIPGNAYAYVAGMPNFYFHFVMVYAILRSRGVQLGKGDYTDSFFLSYGSGLRNCQH